MANIPIYPGSSSFSASLTPFGWYDDDATFISDADKVVKWGARRLGYPIHNVELQDIQFYTAFEEAVNTYGAEVHQYKIRENYHMMEGNSTGSAFNNQVITPNMGNIVRLAKSYGSEAGSGGNTTYYTGSINLLVNQQNYDLDQWALDEGISGSIEIKRIFHESPPAIVKYFDPYAGTGTGIQSLMEAFGFGQMSPGINFILMPLNFDLMKMQAIELNDQIRRSGYSFELVNNKLRVFPIPIGENLKLRFHYIKVLERDNVIKEPATNLITNTSQVPYNNIVYTQINSVGRQWIFNYTLCILKEMLAYIRGKYSTVPIPDSELSLNQADLLMDSRKEKDDLITQLRNTLEETSRKNQLERQSLENNYLRDTLFAVPMPFYIG